MPRKLCTTAGQGEEIDDISKLLRAFRKEAEGLQNWFDIGLKKRGRTTTGTSKLSLSEIVEFFSVFIKENKWADLFNSSPSMNHGKNWRRR
jgi:hypothetical protein